MSTGTLRTILWLHTLLAGAFGLALYLVPGAAAGAWPWPLPPLAARFVGALLIGAAVDTGLTVAARNALPLNGSLLMAAVLYGLIVLAGVLAVAQVGPTNGLLLWIALLGAVSLLAAALLTARMGAPLDRAGARPQTRFLRGLLVLDLLLVAPVGLLMYLVPAIARRFWPWDMPTLNVRLIGSIFVATLVLSAWALRRRTWDEVRPRIAAGGAFATLALIASYLHFGLFDRGPLLTWLFIALDAIVSLGAWLAMLQYARQSYNRI